MELKKLKAMAEEVKGWSNCNQAWLDHSEDEPAAVVGHIGEGGETYPVAVIDCDQYYAAQDSLKLAQFYADRTLTKSPITPADQAEAYFLLVSQRLSKTTGQVITVDGGLY